MVSIYSSQSNHSKIKQCFKNCNVCCKDIVSLWDLSLLENLYNDILEGNIVVVVNPDFDILDLDCFIKFVDYCKISCKNVFFSPQINPKFFIKDPIWFSLKSLDALQNYLIEFLYKNSSINTKFRNQLHKKIRKNSISRVDIPKYLTNLSGSWERYENPYLSNMFLNAYSDIYFENPTNVHVAISNRCNLKCVMCPYHSPEIKPMHTSDFFKTSRFMDIECFSEIAKFCGQNQIFLQFGQLDEPLLHPRFTEFLKIAKIFNVAVNLTTNGTLLDHKIALAIVESSISNITFSLDAIDKESYKEIRGYDYDTTLSNIKVLIDLLKSHKKEIELSVCFILQGKNAEEKSKKFLEYWISMVKRVKFHQLTRYNVDKDGILIPNNQGTFRGNSEARYPCSIPWKTLFVTPDHQVTFCCTSMAEHATSSCAGGGGALVL